MPIITNRDGTKGIQDENAMPPQFPNVPQGVPPMQGGGGGAEQEGQAPQPKGRITPEMFEMETYITNPETGERRPRLLPEMFDDMDTPHFNPEKAVADARAEKSLLSEDIAGGVLQGVTVDNFSASMGTIMESYLPSWATGRIVMTDENGNFQTPEYKTVNEYVGVDDETWGDMEPEERRKLITKYSKEQVLKMTGADPDSTAFMISNFAGMLIDPTTAIPLAGATRLSQAGRGAGLGAADVGAYEMAQEGSPTLGGMALGATIGGGLGALIKGAPSLKPVGHADPKVRDVSAKKVQSFERMWRELSETEGVSPSGAYKEALKRNNLTADDLDTLTRDSGHETSWLMPHKKNKSERWDATKGTMEVFDKVFEPISDRIKQISPFIWKKAVDMEYKMHERMHKFSLMSDDFLRKDVETLRKRDESAFRLLKKAMLTNDEKLFNSIASKNFKTGWEKNYASYREAMHEMYGLTRSARKSKKIGALGKESALYLHRDIRDVGAVLEAVGKQERSRIESIIDKQFKNGATEAERAKVINEYMSGYYDKAGKRSTPNATKQRSITKKMFDDNPKLIDAYRDPAEASHNYLRSGIEDVYTKQFLGAKIVDKFGDDVDRKSIGKFIAEQHTGGKLSYDQVEELKTLLETRLIHASKGPNKVVQNFKNLSYAALLGNPISALTQLGDIYLAASKYGFRDTVKGLIDAVQGRGLTPKEFGLMDNLMEEMSSEKGITRWILQKSLTYSGFASVDRIGKAVNLNAAMHKAKRLANTPQGRMRLRSKWGEAYGDDFGGLMDDLSKGMSTDRTRSLAFAELSDIQPITMLEMPEAYLKGGSFRVLYMLRTFQVKYMNLLRKHGVDQIKRGNYKEGISAIAMIGGMFTAGGMSTDALKSYVLDRNFSLAESAFDNSLRNTGILDRYTVSNMGSAPDPLMSVIKGMAPPINTLSPAVMAMRDLAFKGELTDRTQKQLVKQIPIVGKWFENYYLDGNHEYNLSQWNRQIKGD